MSESVPFGANLALGGLGSLFIIGGFIGIGFAIQAFKVWKEDLAYARFCRMQNNPAYASMC
jgi:hypothetical protein